MFDLTKPVQTMSSREMADLTEKRHDSVKRTIDTLAEKGVIALPQIVETSFAGADGRKQAVTEYRIGKRDSYVIVAQLSPEFTARLVDRWQELEADAAKPTELSRIDILKLAMESEEARIAAEAKLVEQAPKVQGFDRIANGEGSMCLQSAAKHLQVQPKKFFSWMQERRRIYRRPGGSGYLGYQDQIQTGYLEHKVTTIERSDGSTKVVEQVRVTPKGLAKFAIELGRN